MLSPALAELLCNFAEEFGQDIPALTFFLLSAHRGYPSKQTDSCSVASLSTRE